MIHKRPLANLSKVMVVFEIPGTVWAERINLVGDFNAWDRDGTPFRRNRQEDWEAEVELEAGREYHFRYLLDGEHWRYDSHADKSSPNLRGGFDSVVVTDVRRWV